MGSSAGHPVAARRQRRAEPQDRRTGADAQRLQHGLVVLVLVADDQAECERGVHASAVLGRQRVQSVERLGAHGATERPRILGRQQRQVHPAGAGVLEGVVEPLDRRGQ
jgi:hypothetical protein